ncbi:hypothetical protein [Rhizobium sp. AN80A]|uniref:hypothetical protein n=1 Tax=Rhizobium sp. AN80A TaxID=3040673 RepID=UPI0024B38420|nr:hypothetical protein [Rhizobium sp. AN80A]
MQLLNHLHDALERHLPSIVDEGDRHEALRYLRGLKSVLATKVDTTGSNVIPFDDHLMRRRLERAIAKTHARQIAEARRVYQRAADEFGWHIYDDID